MLVGGGHKVARAELAQQGWRQLREWKPELLVLDLALPDEPGLDLLQRVRTASPVLVQRSTGGHGLGLAFCKTVVEQHGGKFGVEAAAGGGARFWFTVPVTGA